MHRILIVMVLSTVASVTVAQAAPLLNGLRPVGQITAALTVEPGPVPQELVLEYLQASEKIGVLHRR